MELGNEIDHVALVLDTINPNHILELVKDRRAGAISTFIGTTRDTFEGRIIVPFLFF
jgi:molybdopterin synthase catalytic subunit